jgi:hypothetical protein
MDLIYIVSTWLLPVLIAITFHEAAHGYVASFLGDDELPPNLGDGRVRRQRFELAI